MSKILSFKQRFSLVDTGHSRIHPNAGFLGKWTEPRRISPNSTCTILEIDRLSGCTITDRSSLKQIT